jgi:hypothetical protein
MAKNKRRDSIVPAASPPHDRPPADARQFGRSRVSNAVARGSILWLDHVDKRGPVPRRFKDIIGLVTADLGGPDLLSEGQRQLIRRIASLSVWCESQEAKMADGTAIDIDEFQRASNSLRRLLESIGLKRVAKDIGPTLGDLLIRDHVQQQMVKKAAAAAEVKEDA